MIRRTKPIARTTRPSRRRKGRVATTRRKLNLMWSEIIRRSHGGRCWMEGKDDMDCAGPIQAAHCFGKKALPAARYALFNGLPLCKSHHCSYTYRVEAWNYILMTSWGPEMYAERYRMAAAIPKHDYAAIHAELAAALEQVA